ncbi:MAG: hypothetical protein RBT80_06995 [Candidatus Vecturithrix sp.]|nr:hypothetical protein [Candidatus Vecturithrix sp.]
MPTRRIDHVALIVVLWCFPLTVHAWNRLPLQADTPSVLQSGTLQCDLGLQYLNRTNFPFSAFSKDSGRDVLSLPALGLRIGLGKRSEFQLSYEVLFVEEEEFRIREVWKSGDLDLFTKIELWQERQWLPATGIKVGVKLPNAGNDYRVGTDETDFAFSTLFAKHFALITTTANVGLLILGNSFEQATQDDLLSYALACSLPWNSHVTTIAEIAGQMFGTADNERSSALFHLHLHTDNTTWKLSGRVGLLDNSEDWGLAAGVSWTWDGLKHLMDENE